MQVINDKINHANKLKEEKNNETNTNTVKMKDKSSRTLRPCSLNYVEAEFEKVLDSFLKKTRSNSAPSSFLNSTKINQKKGNLLKLDEKNVKEKKKFKDKFKSLFNKLESSKKKDRNSLISIRKDKVASLPDKNDDKIMNAGSKRGKVFDSRSKEKIDNTFLPENKPVCLNVFYDSTQEPESNLNLSETINVSQSLDSNIPPQYPPPPPPPPPPPLFSLDNQLDYINMNERFPLKLKEDEEDEDEDNKRQSKISKPIKFIDDEEDNDLDDVYYDYVDSDNGKMGSKATNEKIKNKRRIGSQATYFDKGDDPHSSILTFRPFSHPSAFPSNHQEDVVDGNHFLGRNTIGSDVDKKFDDAEITKIVARLDEISREIDPTIYSDNLSKLISLLHENLSSERMREYLVEYMRKSIGQVDSLIHQIVLILLSLESINNILDQFNFEQVRTQFIELFNYYFGERVAQSGGLGNIVDNL